MTQKYQVKVSMKQAAIVETGIVLKQGDFGMQIEIEVLDFDATGTTPQIVFRKAMGAVESTTITVSSNKYTYTFKGTELDTPGKCFCDLKLKNSTTQRISTASFMFKVVADTLDGLAEEASSYSDTIEQLLGDVVHLSDTPGLVKNDGTIDTNIYALNEDLESLNSEVEEAKVEIANLNNGYKTVTPIFNWQSGWITTTGLVNSSGASKFALFELKKGQTVTVGTKNQNISIISTTNQSSVSVGDTVTPLRTTSGTVQFETYEYTAETDMNIVICVLWSNYTAEVTEPADFMDEINAMFEETIQKSETAGLVKNDGTIDTNSYALESETDNIENNINNLEKGQKTVTPIFNWQSGWITTTGLVNSSGASKFALFELKKGQTVTVGTNNQNISIISTTNQSSVSVGDTVTPLRTTSGTVQFETYEYTAETDMNIVICVLWSNYTAEVTEPAEFFNIINTPLVLGDPESYMAEAFDDFVVQSQNPSDNIKLFRVLRKAGNPEVYAVGISINGTVRYILNQLSTSYTETKYNAFDLIDIKGYFLINWSKFTIGQDYTNLNIPIKQNRLEPLPYSAYQNVDILLPQAINAVVGHELALEFYNIVYCDCPEEFTMDASSTSAQIQNLDEKLRIVPTEAASVSETLTLYKTDTRIKNKTFTLNILADEQPTIKALFIGDSMTNAGTYIAELKNLLGSNLTLYGTRSITATDSDNNQRVVNHEGRAGWSAYNYTHSASKGDVTNAFYNNGFDFSYYMANNPTFSDLTDVFILLGTNDGEDSSFIENYKQICDSIKAYNENIRVHCMIPIPPIKSGYAFGTRNYISYKKFKKYMYNIGKRIIEEYSGISGFSIIPTHANLDCWYDFPRTTVAVNSRNPETMEVGNDNVHPNKYGYYRMADTIYADIIASCQ